MSTPRCERPWYPAYGDIPREIPDDRPTSVVALLEPALQQYAQRVAFQAFGQSLRYAELDQLSARFACYLQRRLKVGKGDRVGVMLPNLVAFPIVFLGLARIGAVQVNINPGYTPRELLHQLDDAGVQVLVVAAACTATLGEIVEGCGLRRIVSVAADDGLPQVAARPSIDGRLQHVLALAEILDPANPCDYHAPVIGEADPLFLQYTGGTTGLSKGACLSHGNLVANVAQFKAFAEAFTRPGDEVVVTALPLYHIFALMVNLISYLTLGAENWLVASGRDLDAVVDTLRRARPTMFSGVNTLFAGLCAHPRIGDVDFSRLRWTVGGGAAVHAVTSERWRQITGVIIREGYGLSETSPILTLNPPSVTEFSGTAGAPLPSTDIKLIDADGQQVDYHQEGEICARGPQVMAGYWRNPEATAAAFTADGYFRTGDVGRFDARGLLRIVDRIKDMIIVSGFNVYPNEVEAVASSHAEVAECACIGAPDPRSGEAVHLYVVRKPDSRLDEAALVAHCRSQLAAYKVPRQVHFVEALPKSTVGKILRRELRARG